MKTASFLAFLLACTAPAASAWNLVNKVNADSRGMPGAESFVSVTSGSASAYATDGNARPGKVICSSGTTCRFGPISASILVNGKRTVTPMGCTTWNNCGYQITDTNVAVTTGMSWDDAIKTWVARYGTSITRSYAYAYSTDPGWTVRICAAWGTYTTGGYYMLPGTDSCATPPIPPNQCDVLGVSVDLNFGDLKIGDITGARKQATRQVRCTRKASVRYQVSVGNPFPLGNGISSTLTVNGIRAGEMISLPAGTSTLTIASTLTDTGARAGAFSKTVVLIQSFM